MRDDIPILPSPHTSRQKSRGFQYIRDYYGVPAKRGEPVDYQGRPGRVTGTSGPYVIVRLYGDKLSLPYHPYDLAWLKDGEFLKK